ncbi:MAG TPA: tetratricopeptide repeat protein [Bryobacteraceae bacterium]|nr:tetratricopeptide repeat protein [Bryobacteraceae bacterium]
MSKSIRTLALLSVVSVAAADPTAEALIDNGHFKRAREIAEPAYKAHPEDAHANYVLARIQHEFNNLDDAAKLAEAAVRLDPKSSPAHRELGEIYADQADHASFLKQLGFARKVHAEFDAALAIAPKDPDNLFDQVQYFMEAPGVVGGDKNKAAQLANDLLQIDPARGYLALAYIARTEKQDDKLEGLYQKAVHANPRNYEAQITLANYYISPQHADFVQAEQHSQAALELNPDRIEAYRMLAIVLVLQKRYDDAAKLIARAQQAIPDDLSPCVYAARAMLRSGLELPEAETYLKKYFTETREPEAGAPLIAGAHWSLGLVYEKEGRKQDARNELETALRLKPDFEPARKDLKRLK